MLKYLLIIVAVVASILIAFVGYSYHKLQPKIDLPEQLESSELKSYLDQVVTDNKMPSLAAAIIDQNGTRHSAYAGVRKYGDTTVVTAQDLYHIGSCTKAMTSVLTAMLIDDGLLQWDTRIIDVFPELDTVILETYRSSTVRDLLTHTAGFSANTEDFHRFNNLPIQEQRYKVLYNAVQQPSEQGMGTYVYSNLGYTIVGSILEKLSGLPWEELMAERIFAPLNMNSAGFGVPSTQGKLDQPWGHYKPLGIGKWTSIQHDNPASMGPSGTVHCTLEDWGKFISFQLLSNDTTLLSTAQREILLKVHKDDYAAGWIVVDRSWAKGKAYTHAGSNTMNYALAWVAPAIDRAYIVCTNSASQNTHQICDGVIGALLKVDKNDN